MNVVIYARYSSDNQREESIEGQIRECKAFAERKGYTVVNIYADRAISGKRADNRPEFQQMITDSENGGFEAIIVWKIDRFSRNKYDSVIYKSKLNKNGVGVISATEPIDDSPEGKLMESIFEGFSEYYVKELAVKTTRGMTENAIKGKFNGGFVTYGYKIDENGHFRKDPTAAPVVVDIFNRYADGETIRSIVEDLNNRGITNNGRRFTYSTMSWLLKNERYIGKYTFKDTVNTEAIPPLISEEIFERCQRRRVTNKHKSASFIQVEEKYLLTGKIYCGHCGCSMSGVSGTSKSNATYRYYQCMNSKKKKCKKKPVKKDAIEGVVFRITISMLKDKELVKKISAACYELQSEESTLLPALRKQLKQNKKEIQNIMKAVKAGLVTKSTKEELERLEEEQENLELEIAREQIKRPVISREKIEEWLLKLAESDFSTTEQKQRLIDIFVNSIYVYDDHIKLFFNYKNGEKTVDFSQIENNEKKSNTQNECSTLLKFGDAKRGIEQYELADFVFQFRRRKSRYKPALAASHQENT